MNSITIPKWFDRHLHIRDGEMLKTVLPCTLNQHVAGAVIMGNLKHPDEITTIEKALAYKERIASLIPSGIAFKPCMTLYLTDDITPEEVVRGFEAGAWCAVKLYIAGQGGGGTTNSGHGVKDLLGRYLVFETMEKHRIPLLGHFEAVEKEIDEFDREVTSMDRDLLPLLKRFPELRVVVEHITDHRMADCVAEVDHPIYATVTAHHLMESRNTLFWGGINPGYFCKPVLKRESHRLGVRKYVTSGHRRFGAGTDSAPHDETAKSQCYGCAAGIFTAPAAVELYTTVFAQDHALRHLGPFLSKNFLDLYGMEISSEEITIELKSFLIPKKIGNVQVFKGGEVLQWKLVG